jgi:branched-chain amino acid aminotransferase
LQYAQTCFEGMKAYTTQDGRVVIFRPDMNAKRMYETAQRLEMPPFPQDKFVEAVKKVVKANLKYVPPFGTGASLYIRPYMFGIAPVMGVKPSAEYQFRVFVSPVGPYFKGGAKPITLTVSDFDRAAPNGTVHVKAGLNYAMSLHAIVEAHKNGYAENLYPDAKTRTKVEETGGANFFFVTKDNKIVTPKSNSILPSITRRSLMQVAKEYLGLETEEREVYLTELSNFKECGLCGTAAVISPVGKINDHGKEICFPSGMEKMGEIVKKYNLPVQSHLSENLSEIEWIKKLRTDDNFYGESYNKNGLFGNVTKTIMAHCIHCPKDEDDLIKKNGVYIAHCPTSNSNLSSGICPASKYLREGFNIGLGSDVSGGHTLDLFEVMRHVIQVSKLRFRCVDSNDKILGLAETLFMATNNGGKFFGNVGIFENNYEFDALVLDESLVKNFREFNESERLERFIYHKDAKIEAKFIQGNKII